MVLELWDQRQEEMQNNTDNLDTKILELRAAAKATAEKIRFLSSEIAIKYMEEDLIKIEQEINELEAAKALNTPKKEVNMDVVMDNVSYFLEHLEELLLDTKNSLKKAEYFGLLFEETPTYEDLLSGTPKLAPYLALKSHFDGGSGTVCAPDRTRTCDLLLRRQLLYPAELLAHS